MNFSFYLFVVANFREYFINLFYFILFYTEQVKIYSNRSFQRTTVDCVLKQCCSMITVSHTIPKTVGFYSERCFDIKTTKKNRTHFVQEENSHCKRYM